MDACRKEGVRKLVFPATRALFLSRSLSARAPCASRGTGGTGAGGCDSLAAGLRNETLDSILDLDLLFSSGGCSSDARSLPLPLTPWLGTMAPVSSTGALIFAFDLVAVRKLCSNDDRSRLNVLGCASW